MADEHKKDKDPEAVDQGQRIKKARKQAGLTQSDLGMRLNPPTSWRTVAHWEAGDYSPKSPRREQLGVILGIDLGGIDGVSKAELTQELLRIRTMVDQLLARI